MSPLRQIENDVDELTKIRRDLHENPELGFEVHRTAEIVTRELKRIGLEVHTGIGRTGVVASLRKGTSSRAIGLRADMDALPIQEATDVSYRSKVSQCMHACGHDGHTTFLLGAARYLAKFGNFDGTVHFIFQPAEEIFGGAKAMMDDGLFDRFPCEAVYGVHNRPGIPVGKFAIRPGAMFAGGASFHIDVRGRGSHGARPEDSIDPVLTASHITLALQSIVSRNIAPSETAVVSVTQMTGGPAFNVIPQSATLGGTARAYNSEVLATIEKRMKTLTTSVAAGFGATATIDFKVLVPPLMNERDATQQFIETAKELVGADNVNTNGAASMASDDFSFMLEKRRGAYMIVGITGGNQGTALLHTPEYDFNDAAIPSGAALLARVAERELAI
jgi:hippurate hydrolase